MPRSESPRGVTRLAAVLRRDVTGGVLLISAMACALVLSNSSGESWYASVRDTHVGVAAIGLDLSVGEWAADGLLAIFFFTVGLELKHEFVVGSLRDPRVAILPIAAAIGGVICPAVIYTLVNANVGGDALRGWAVPAATDIAFAVAVLAIVGRHLPSELRTFLLTLAVVDDLLGITIIAVFYTDGIDFVALGGALLGVVAFAVLVHSRFHPWWLLMALGVIVWVLVHASGVHATVAGVLLGLSVPAVVTPRASHPRPEGDRIALTQRYSELWVPFSTAVAVPIFAFFSAGVPVGGWSGLVSALGDSVALGVIVALVMGKAGGIVGTTFLMTRLPGVRLDPALRWWDMIGMGFIAGIGFTVSLLIGELAFGTGSVHDDHAKVGILVGSLVSACIGAGILVSRQRR